MKSGFTSAGAIGQYRILGTHRLSLLVEGQATYNVYSRRSGGCRGDGGMVLDAGWNRLQSDLRYTFDARGAGIERRPFSFSFGKIV